jgi:hypothetical protein
LRSRSGLRSRLDSSADGFAGPTSRSVTHVTDPVLPKLFPGKLRVPATEIAMRAYRFVRFLGDTVEAVGRELSDATADLAREIDAGQLPTEVEPADAFAERVSREFPRRVQSRLDGAEKGGVAFTARVVSGGHDAAENRAREASPTTDLGIVLAVDLPDYSLTTAMLADCRTWATPTERERYDTDGLADAAGSMLDRTADAFVLALPVDGGVAVVPAAAIAAVDAAGEPVPATFPHDLYARSAGRFVEEFAEGFVGDGAIAPDVSASMAWEEVDLELRAFQREFGVRDVLYLSVSVADEGSVPTLGDFVGQ